MPWYLAAIFVGTFGYAMYCSEQAKKHLSEEGKKNIQRVRLLGSLARKDYFTEEGMRYCRTANTVAPLSLILTMAIWHAGWLFGWW
jgi:hypothetical protein